MQKIHLLCLCYTKRNQFYEFVIIQHNLIDYCKVVIEISKLLFSNNYAINSHHQLVACCKRLAGSIGARLFAHTPIKSYFSLVKCPGYGLLPVLKWNDWVELLESLGINPRFVAIVIPCVLQQRQVHKRNLCSWYRQPISEKCKLL